MKGDEELADAFTEVLKAHGVEAPHEKVVGVVALIKERATFVQDFWTISSYLFVAPAEFEKYGIKAGAAVEQKPADPRRAPDPRAKVYDDAATAPFLAKDVDKFWKEENYTLALKAVEYLRGCGCGSDKESIEKALEDYIKENGWPMGKVMNCLRLALTGASSGLGIADIISFIGMDELGRRMDYICSRLG